MPRRRGLAARERAYDTVAGPMPATGGRGVAAALLSMLGKPDTAPLVRRLPGTENPNLLATGADVTEAAVQ
eukprot:9923176-Lingulodinium_polyedra.AAC.1